MSKDYSDVTRMSVTDPNQFGLRMLWPGSGQGTAVCRAGDGRRAADGRHAGCIKSRHTPGSRDGTAPVTLRDPGTGRHRSHSGTGRHLSHSGTPGRDGTGHNSHSGTPRRDGIGHTPGPRDGTAPVTLRDPGTDGTGHTPGPRDGRHRSHSGIPGRDGLGHTPGPRDGTSHTPPGN